MLCFYTHNLFRLPLFITVVSTKSDSDVIFCLQLLSKTLTCTLHLSQRESIDHLFINPILSIDYNVPDIICKQNIQSLSLLAGRTVL